MKIKVVALAVAVSVVMSVGIAGAAQASSVARSQISVEGTTAAPTGEWVDSAGYIRVPQSELQPLVGTQSPAQVSAVIDSGKPYNAIFDTTTQKYIAAAYAKKAAFRPLTIVTGCGRSGEATVDQMVSGGGRATCYSGTGSKTVNLPNTYYLSAGAYLTTLWYGPGAIYGVYAAAGNSIYLSPYITTEVITRS